MCEMWEKIWNSHNFNERELLAQIAFAKSAEEVLEEIICYKLNFLIELNDSIITEIQPSFLKDKDGFDLIKVLRIQLQLPYWDESFNKEIDGVSGINVNITDINVDNRDNVSPFAAASYQGAAYGMSSRLFNPTVIIAQIMIRVDQLSEKSMKKIQSSQYGSI